jgi:hypothetical protein
MRDEDIREIIVLVHAPKRREWVTICHEIRHNRVLLLPHLFCGVKKYIFLIEVQPT